MTLPRPANLLQEPARSEYDKTRGRDHQRILHLEHVRIQNVTNHSKGQYDHSCHLESAADFVEHGSLAIDVPGF
jgi:hypothetical protein